MSNKKIEREYTGCESLARLIGTSVQQIIRWDKVVRIPRSSWHVTYGRENYDSLTASQVRTWLRQVDDSLHVPPHRRGLNRKFRNLVYYSDSVFPGV